jgi:hypothetical protein
MNHKRIKTLSILLGMLLIATIVPIIQASQTKIQNIHNQPFVPSVYVESSILLTKTKLPILNAALNHIDNANLKQLIQKIIIILSTKGNVNNQDILEIIDDLNLRNIQIHSGWIESHSEGTAVTPRMTTKFLLKETLLQDNTWGGIGIGPAVMCKWSAENHTDLGLETKTSINGIERCSATHEGIILGFCGSIKLNIVSGVFHLRSAYGLKGLGCLIIITS